MQVMCIFKDRYKGSRWKFITIFTRWRTSLGYLGVEQPRLSMGHTRIVFPLFLSRKTETNIITQILALSHLRAVKNSGKTIYPMLVQVDIFYFGKGGSAHFQNFTKDGDFNCKTSYFLFLD